MALWMVRGGKERCKVKPTRHLIERMGPTQRGFTALEVNHAVYHGSKERIQPRKYKGRWRLCEVVVYERPCTLIVTTVEDPNVY